MKLKWSQFLVIQTSKDNQRLLIRNNLNSRTISIARDIKLIIDSIIKNSQQEEIVPSFINDQISFLKKAAILVPINQDEEKKFYQYLSKVETRSNRSFSTAIVTTTNCQFQCSYCYEQGINRQEGLTIDTAQKIILWCSNYLTNHKECDSWTVSFFGGEPLLNKKIIQYLLPKIKKLAKEKKVALKTQLSTNGELLDLHTLSFLNKYNLDKVDISIDGPKKVHDQRRFVNKNQGTFDKIIKNLTNGIDHNLLKNVNISITCDKQNTDSLPLLFDFLKKKKLQNKVNLCFNMIYTSTSGGLSNKQSSSHLKKIHFSEKQKAIKYLWLCQEAKKRGFRILSVWELGPFCNARRNGSVVFQPNGSLLKCCRGIGHPEFVFGNIDTIQNAIDPNYCLPISLKKCFSEKCPLIPICNGGCRVDGFLSNKNYSDTNCRRLFMETVNKGLLQLNFD